MALKLPAGTMGTSIYGIPAPNYSTASNGRGSYSASSRGGTGGGVSFNSNAYGSIPNPTPIPKSTWEEANAADPNFASLQQGSDAIIKSQQSGQLSPETIKSLQDNAATFGVSSGMPGSGLQANRGLRDLGLNVEALQQQGLTNYLNSLKTIGSMQLDPSLVSNINTYNNQLASAPDPAAAAAQEEALWQQHFKQTRGPAGPTGSYGSGPVGPRINPGPLGGIKLNSDSSSDPFHLASTPGIFGSLAGAGGITQGETPLWGPQGYNFNPNSVNMGVNPVQNGGNYYIGDQYGNGVGDSSLADYGSAEPSYWDPNSPDFGLPNY